MTSSSIDIYVRLSLPRDKNVLADLGISLGKHISGVIIEPHIFEVFSNSFSSFLAKSKLPYFIDMSLHRFMAGIHDAYDSKPWYDKLVEKFELPLSEEHPYLSPKYILYNEDKIKKIARSALNYEIHEIPKKIEDTLGLVKFFGTDVESRNTLPKILVAPYIVIDESALTNEELTTGDDPLELSLKLNIKVLEEFSRAVRDLELPVMGVIALGKSVLYNKEFIEKIVREYLAQNPDYIGVWVSGLDEWEDYEMLKPFVENLLSKIRELSRESKENVKIINLYGGFFSLILSKLGYLDGVAHGILHSDVRRHDIVSTGITPRYYVSFLHRPISKSSFIELFKTKLPSCDCPICRKYGTSHAEFLKIFGSWNDLAAHFLYTRIREKEELANISFNDIVSMLSNDVSKLEEYGINKNHYLAKHLEKWASFLSKLSLPR